MYIPGAIPGSLHGALAMRDDNKVVAGVFKPLDAFNQTVDGHRFIWHVLPEPGSTGKQVRIWNELHLLQLSVNNSDGKAACGALDGSPNSLFILQPSADAAAYGLVPVLRKTPLCTNTVQADLNGQPLVALPDLNSVDPRTRPFAAIQMAASLFKVWSFVPISSVLAPLLALPKCVLGPGIISDQSSIDAMKTQVLSDLGQASGFKTEVVPYRPGRSSTSYRMISYGSIFLAVSDVSRRAVSRGLDATVDLSDIVDATHWFTIADNKIVSLSDMQPRMWQMVTGIDDTVASSKPNYIVLGYSDRGFPIVSTLR